VLEGALSAPLAPPGADAPCPPQRDPGRAMETGARDQGPTRPSRPAQREARRL